MFVLNQKHVPSSDGFVESGRGAGLESDVEIDAQVGGDTFARICPVCAYAWHDICAVQLLFQVSDAYGNGDDARSDAGAINEWDDIGSIVAKEFSHALRKTKEAHPQHSRRSSSAGWWHWMEVDRAERLLVSTTTSDDADATAAVESLRSTLADHLVKDVRVGMCPLCRLIARSEDMDNF